MQDRLGTIQISNKLTQTFRREELLIPRFVRALINQADPDSLGQEGKLAESLFQNVKVKLNPREDLGVGQEANRCTGCLGGPFRANGRLRLSFLIRLPPDLSIPANFSLQPLR